MPADDVDEIKSRLDIVEVVGQHVRLRPGGRDRFVGLCPFHNERTPSFGVSRERQTWYCFGCQKGGDLFTFIEDFEHLDFRQALEMLAERAGVELTQARGGAQDGRRRERRLRALALNRRAQLFYAHLLWDHAAGAPGRELLAERGVSEELARRFGVGFAPSGGAGGDALVRYLVRKGEVRADEVADAGLAHPPERGRNGRDRFRHRLVFPIRDERGETLGFGARALGDAQPKYLNTPETALYSKSTALFGIDHARAAIAAAGSTLVVEGYFDVIAAHAAGVAGVVASSGTALTPAQARTLLRHAPVVVLCFDGDAAGQAAASRAVDVVAAEGLAARICLIPDGFKDPDELVRRDPARFVQVVAEARPEWQVLLDRALAGGEGGSVEDRRAAQPRAVAVIARIPDAATRELYAQELSRRLEVSVAAVLEGVEAVRRGGRASRTQVRMPPRAAPSTAPEGGGGAGAEGTRPGGLQRPDRGDARDDGGADAGVRSSSAPVGAPPPTWEDHLGGLAVQAPGVAARLVRDFHLDLEEIAHPGVRRILEVGAALGPDQPFPAHELEEAEARLVVRFGMLTLPMLTDDDPARVDVAIADCVRRVHESALLRRYRDLLVQQRRARDEGRADDERRLASEIWPLAAELGPLRRTVRVD